MSSQPRPKKRLAAQENVFLRTMRRVPGGFIGTVRLHGRVLFALWTASLQEVEREVDAWCQRWAHHDFGVGARAGGGQ